MLRKILILLMVVMLSGTTYGCVESSASLQTQSPLNRETNVRAVPSSIASGKYPVQQATYDDVSGEYSLMLLNTPAGSPPMLKTDQIQMARLDDEAIATGEKTYLQADGEQLVMYLTEDFRIEYVHNVTETKEDPLTGQPQTVVIRRESSFWTPFAGALAGQAIGSMLFRPHYYLPPVYQPGGVLTGYGGYGRSYSQAVNRYQERYNAAPAAVKNRRNFRTTGNIRNTARNTSKLRNIQKQRSNSRASGSGFGSNTLRTSGKARQLKRPSSFGSGGMRRPSRSFGGGMRRRR